MSVLSRLLPVLMAPVVVAGCSFSSSEPWQPPEAPESQTFTTFGRPVPSGDYAKLQAADQVRSVDPCALLGPDRLARYGGIATVGPSRSLSECVINLAMAGSRALSVIEVDLSSNGPSSDDQTLDVAGETVAIDNVLSSEFRCVYQVPMRFRSTAAAETTTAVPDIVELPPLPYMTISAENLVASRDANCRVAQEVVTDVITMFAEDRVPLRDQSQTRVALADRSPCALLEHFPADHPADRFDVTTEPYECQFWAGDDIIGMEFLVAPGDSAMNPVLNQRIENIAGHPVLVDENTTLPGDPTCYFSFPVGPVLDTYRPGAPAPEWVRKQARVQSMGKLSGPCPIARELIPAALELFGANR